ncbi:MAG: hypothetical protein KAS13_00690 [Candidatus Omnitrophica bacterium]|nr:hypothetical protein [Candidatus Omnitrophota bacterium]
MGKNILCLFLVLVAVCSGCSRQDAAKEKTQMDLEEKADNFDQDAIDLNDLSSSIIIPVSKGTIKLARGTYVYTYKKKATLRNEKYVVSITDMLSYTAEHKASPDDAYSKTLEIVSAKDKSAIRAIESFKAGGGRIEVQGGVAEARQVIADAKRLNQAKFAIGILPADNTIKNISKEIEESDAITVSGVRYKLSGITNNGKKEPIAYCLSMDVFYLSDLSIDK